MIISGNVWLEKDVLNIISDTSAFVIALPIFSAKSIFCSRHGNHSQSLTNPENSSQKCHFSFLAELLFYELFFDFSDSCHVRWSSAFVCERGDFFLEKKWRRPPEKSLQTFPFFVTRIIKCLSWTFIDVTSSRHKSVTISVKLEKIRTNNFSMYCLFCHFFKFFLSNFRTEFSAKYFSLLNILQKSL